MHRISIVVALAAACGGASAPPTAAPTPDPKIDALVTAALKEHRAVGLSVAVARGGKIVFARGYGMADVARHAPATADTVYRIGSVTKQLTAVAILQLVEQGKLRLGDDIRRYLPRYPTHGKTITLEHLLTHTSGIPSYTSVPDWIEVGKRAMTRAEMVARFADLPLEFDPGTRWSYSNSNYYLLGLVIEAVTGRSYADVMRDRVLAPAGMKASAYCRDGTPGQAAGYRFRGGAPVLAEPLDLAHPYAAGALCSTVKDLLAYQRALDTNVLLRPASLAKMRQISHLSSGAPTGYGYGLFIGDLDGHARIGHGGGINGFTAMLARYPADDLTIAVLSNAEVDLPDRVEQKIARAVLDLPERIVKRDTLPPAERDRYLGTYSIEGFGPDAVQVKVFAEGAALKVQAPGQPVATLLYQGGTAFVLDVDPDIRLEFTPDGFTLHQGGMAIHAKRTP